MPRRPFDPVQDITFGQALTISLNNYYDLLKTQVGGLKANEFLQLKLVADLVDISPEKKASDGGYVWNSYYNLLTRSDRAVEPSPISGDIQVGLASLASVYERFLRKLRTYVVKKDLSPDDQKAIADLDKDLDALKDDANNLAIADRTKWKHIADAMGYQIGDWESYIQWSAQYGHLQDIQYKTDQIKEKTVDKKNILDKQYPTPEDREIVDAEFDLENPANRLRFPVWPDNRYPDGDQFNLVYLARLPTGSTALFDDRLSAAWDKTLTTIKTTGAGSFDAKFDKNTDDSSSITTDWSASGSVGYAFISVNVSASEHTQIQSDFQKAESLELGALSTERVNVAFPGWFHPTLFKHKHVVENPHDFQEFFGPKGSLLYYVTALIFLRGFSIKFSSSQNWTYDYEHRFSASGGGGFNAFGISFGTSDSYGSDVKEHHVDKSNTSLSISDDKDTLRFVGYAVMKNSVVADAIEANVEKLYSSIKFA